MFKASFAAFCSILVAASATAAAPAEVAQADAQRKKPLQRCDQLSEGAEIECLHKARERIVETRRKREAARNDGAPGRRK